MNEQDFYPESSRSLDSLRHMRLMALLRDMIEAEGKVQTAAALGVNYRTLVRHEETGRLTDRMADALERHLLLGGGSAAAQRRDRVDALVERVSALERLGCRPAAGESCRAGAAAGRYGKGGCAAASKPSWERSRRSGRSTQGRCGTWSGGWCGWRREGSESETPSPTGAETEPTKRRYVRPRTYPQLVTPEAEPDEDLVYGDAAPVIVEWRRVRAEFLKTRATLDRTEVQEPMLELEIALVGEHGLTLPPASFPWDEFDRRDKVWERTQDLKRVRAERNRALLRRWLRRVLTFGLWRK